MIEDITPHSAQAAQAGALAQKIQRLNFVYDGTFVNVLRAATTLADHAEYMLACSSFVSLTDETPAQRETIAQNTVEARFLQQALDSLGMETDCLYPFNREGVQFAYTVVLDDPDKLLARFPDLHALTLAAPPGLILFERRKSFPLGWLPRDIYSTPKPASRRKAAKASGKTAEVKPDRLAQPPSPASRLTSRPTLRLIVNRDDGDQ